MISIQRTLGIDYGTKRIGLAISDAGNTLATPLTIIPNDLNTFIRLGDTIKKENITEIVIGESVDFSGKLNVLSARIEVFILGLQDKFKLPVYKQKEFLTSVEARRYSNLGGQARKFYGGSNKINPSQAHSKIKQIKSGRVDAKAAALILQRYLDRKNKETEIDNARAKQ